MTDQVEYILFIFVKSGRKVLVINVCHVRDVTANINETAALI